MSLTISKSVCIEVAHHFPGHPIKGNARIHGHSIWVTVSATRDDEIIDGVVLDFGVFENQVRTIAGLLDHQFLNDVPHLGAPTLENIATFIGRRMATVAPLRTVSVKVERPSLGQVAEWTP